MIEAGLNGTQRNNVPEVEIPWEVTDYRFQPQGVYVKTLTSPDRERGDLSVHDVMLGNLLHSFKFDLAIIICSNRIVQSFELILDSHDEKIKTKLYNFVAYRDISAT